MNRNTLRREHAKISVGHLLRLKLLALVLALALTWYALNPAPGPVSRSRRVNDDDPGEKRRESETPAGRRPVFADAGFANLHASALSRGESEETDELDWPEYISLD